MADGYVDLSGVYSRLSAISSQIQTVNYNVDGVRQNVEQVRRETMAEINRLKLQLEEMERQNRFRAAFQRAISEIIRVRQELENNFSTQKKVREYMLGILDASDLALIQKTTISRCTEELMLGAPKYWLAPALIALAAWISDNKPLAKRALAEACRRDDEKVSLLMALITRRVNAGRIQNGKKLVDANIQFKWLNRYFSHQNPLEMRTSIMAFVDAYSNNIFGFDKDNICGDQIEAWMKTLMKKIPNFEDNQKEYWKGVFASRTIHYDSENYRTLKLLCEPAQYKAMDDYLDRICASEDPVDGIKAQFNEMMHAPIDTRKLIEDIDLQLHDLVSKYEESEAELRNEERFLSRVKELEGDEDTAKAQIEAEDAAMRARDVPVNFAQRLSQAINDSSRPSSEKITAIRLLRPYISGAFNEFMVANKDNYPKTIDLRFSEPGKVAFGKSFTWAGQTENGENQEELEATLRKKYDETRDSAVASITDVELKKAEKTRDFWKKWTISIIGAVVTVTASIWIWLYYRSKCKKIDAQNKANREAVRKYYDRNKEASVQLLAKALEGRKEANSVVSNFLAEESSEQIVL